MRARMQGFTLIELMIVVAIIALLAAIAYPSYIKYQVKARRVAGASCLMEMAQYMERYYTTHMSYSGATLPSLPCQTDVANYYTLGASGTPSATAYTLQAVPQGVQAAKDGGCGTLSVNQKGTKSVSGSDEVNQCF